MTQLAQEAPNAATETKNSFMRVEGGVGRPAAASSAFPNANRQALAAACGVSLSHVCKIFNGYTPSLALAGRLARALGVTVEEFSSELDVRRKARLLREQREKRRDKRRKKASSN